MAESSPPVTPVEAVSVALSLMEKIGMHEKTNHGSEQQKREYWLKLFAQCRKVVVEGQTAEQAQKAS
jgi:hypothetical protein